MANTIREKELKTSYPSTSGLTAGTTSQQGHVMQLVATEKSFVTKEQRKGTDY